MKLFYVSSELITYLFCLQVTHTTLVDCNVPPPFFYAIDNLLLFIMMYSVPNLFKE